MTEREICVSYRDAKDKRKQVQIISELSLLPVPEVRAILMINGYKTLGKIGADVQEALKRRGFQYTESGEIKPITEEVAESVEQEPVEVVVEESEPVLAIAFADAEEEAPAALSAEDDEMFDMVEQMLGASLRKIESDIKVLTESLGELKHKRKLLVHFIEEHCRR